MKILSFTEFCALPNGAIYSYYQPAICEGLFRKGTTIYSDGEPIDFYEACLVPQCWNGEHPTVDAIECRWGLYYYEQLFAVFEPKDIETLKNMLP